MKRRDSTARQLRRAFTLVALVVGVTLLAGPSAADLGLNTVSISDVTVNEGDLGETPNAVFTVTLSPADPDSTTTVTYSTSDGSATGGSDYTPEPTGVVLFGLDETTKTISVPVLGDNVDEIDETFNVDLSSVDADIATGDAGTGTATITDDDGPNVTIDDVTVSEAVGNAVFDVHISAPSPQPITVNYSTSNVTAAAGSDYTSEFGSVTFPASTAGDQTITVPILNDSVSEPTETFHVNLTGANDATITDATGVGTITDNEATPTVSIDDSSGSEGGSVVFSVHLSGPSSTAVTATYTASDNPGTASPGDLSGTLTGTVTFPAGSNTNQQVTIATAEDTVDEPDETFTVTLSNLSSNASFSDATATGTILDDDAAPTISIANASASEGTNASFTVSISSASASPITVDYSATPTPGTASASDLTTPPPLSGTVTFPASSTASQTIAIATAEDLVDEPDETFTVTLSNVSAGATISDATATGTIVDDDVTPTVSIDDASGSEGGNVVFNVHLSAPSSTAVTATYTASDNPGTASAGDLSGTLTGTVTFPAGSSATQQVTIATTEDTVDEPDETFTVTLSSLSSNATFADATATGTILDDDAAPTVSIGDATAAEGGNAVFTVSVTNASSTPVTVDYATTHGSTSAADFSGALSGTVTFPAGSAASQTITISTVQDTIDEPNETFVVTLSNVSLNASIGDGSGAGSITDDDATPTVSINDATAAEGGNAVFTVSVTNASSTPVTVNYATTDGSTSPADFTGTRSGTVTFPAGSAASQTINLATFDDTIDETDETFVVTLSGVSANATIGDGSAGGLITDNDNAPTLSINDQASPITEGGSIVYTVNLSAPSGQTVTVAYSLSHGSTAAADFTGATSGTLTFLAGDTSNLITINTVDDSVDEATEDFSVVLSAPTNATIATGQGSGAGQIADDDGPNVTINDVSVDESAGTATFAVHISASSPEAITVNYATANGTAVSPGDYTAKSGSVTFPANTSGNQSIAVTVANDGADELDETFVVNLTGVAGPTATITDNQGQATIIDNDGPNVTINDVSVDESAGTATYAVHVSASSPQPITVNYATANGTAASPGDYTARSGSVTFPANTSADQPIAITIANDTTDEVNETFAVNLSSPTNAIVTDGSGQATIVDDDGPNATINDISVNESAGTATFSVALSAQSPQAITVNYATANGTAVSPGDYTAETGTVTFPANTSATQPIGITIANDSLDEVDETFGVDLTSPTNATITDSQGVGTIVDNDGPTLSVTSPSQQESAGNATFTVSLSAVSPQTITVDYATANGSATTADGDYSARTGQLSIPAGQASGAIQVPISDDTKDEPDETFTLTISNPTNATIGSGQGTGTATIVDNDLPPNLSVSDVTQLEGNPTASTTTAFVFTVSLSQASGKTATVTYTTEPGTASPAVDYQHTPGSLSFAPGETSKTVTVLVNTDSLDEADETFFLTLSGEANAGVAKRSGTATITDDDGAPSLSIADRTVAEGATASFTVTLAPASGQEVRVNYSTANGPSPAATAGADYTAQTGGLLVFAAGETTKTIPVPTLQDALDEANEKFTVTLFNASNALLADDSAEGTITDDDAAPTVSIAPAATVTEGVQSTFNVSLSAVSGQTVTVNFSTTNGTAAAPGDFAAVTNGTVTFNAGETSKPIAITTIDDAVDESDTESFTVTLSAPANATLGTASAGGAIADNDALPQLTINNAAPVTEGGTSAFTVTLTPASERTVTVNYAVAHVTTAAADFSGALSGTVTFAPGDTSEPINVATFNDTLSEAQETFNVALQPGPVNAALGAPNTGTGAINDTPDAAPTVSISGAPVVTEGAQASFNVTLSTASGQAVTVSYATSNSTAVAPGDFNAVASGAVTVTFNAGETSKQIQIQTLDDTLDEPNSETFTVALSNPTNVTIAGGPATGTINDNDNPPTVSIANAPAVTEGAPASFGVTLTAASGQTVTVNYSTTHITTVAADFTGALSGTVTFAPGDPLTKQVTLATVDDSLDEADAETFTVTLATPVNATLGAQSSGTGTINDNDALPALTVTDGSAFEGTPPPDGLGVCATPPAPGTTPTGCVWFTVSLSAPSGRQVTVQYATAGGNATAGTDYATVPATTLTFAAGTTSQAVGVRINKDDTDESNETFNLNLTGQVNATLGDAVGVGTILDDDGAPALTVTGARELEGNPDDAIVVVALAPSSSNQVTVNFTTQNGSAVAPNDYTAFTQTVTFTPGQTSKAITINLVNDTADEDEESFTVNLSGEVNATVRNGNDRRGFVEIVDDDPLPTLSIGDATVTEGNAGTVNASFPVLLSPASGKTVTVAYGSANGSALEADDYTASIGTLSFAPGETSKTVTVPVSGDTAFEGDESFFVNLSTPSNATIGDAQGIATILNDDEQPPPPPPPPPPIDTTTPTTTSTTTTTTTGPTTTRATTNPAPPKLVGMGISPAPVQLIDDLAPVGITCSKKAKGTCFGTVVVQGQVRTLAIVGGRPTAKAVNLGRESFAIARGRTEKVLVRLSKRAVKAVKAAGKLRVTIVVTARDSAGKRTTKPVKRQIWLKVARKGKQGRTGTGSKP